MHDRLWRTALAVCVLLLLSCAAAAQTVVPIAINGDAANRIDIAVLGDGYTAADMPKFAADVNQFLEGIFAQQPFAEYRRYFNARRVEVASAESGVSHPNHGITRNTAFGAYYNCSNIERLVCVDTSRVSAVLSQYLPPNQRDLVVIIVNDQEYGGSGGAYAVTSLNGWGVGIVLHEAGHAFGNLADEYGPPPPPSCSDAVEPREPNVTRETARARIKWNQWIDPSTQVPTPPTANGIIGLFSGAKYCDTLYRSVFSSAMRNVADQFYQVNVEQLIRRIYAYVDPIDSVTPSPGSTITLSDLQTFSVSSPAPATHALTVGWWVDNDLRCSECQYRLSRNDLSPGRHTLQLAVSDPTDMVRADPSNVLIGTASWTVTIDGASTDFTMTADRTSLAVTRGQPGSVSLTVTPASGAFADPVSFSCSGLPDKAQCAFAPASIPAGSAATSTTVTLTTIAPSLTAPKSTPSRAKSRAPALAYLMLPGLALLGAPCRRRRRQLLLSALLLITVGTAMACGAGVTTPPDKSPQPPTNPGTPAGNYSVTVTATSAGVSRSVTLALAVQ